jgi:CheY-like chemotaxis protein
VARVLVIDDDPAVRSVIQLVLEREGHAITVASDGRAGLKALDAGAIDLLIVDIFMPGMDGLETIRAVRAKHAELPVIVISGSSIFSSSEPAPDFLMMAIKLGAVRGLRKPFRPGDLVDAVHDCLGAADRAQRCGNERAG